MSPGQRSVLVNARANSRSLRTTVPAGIVSQFGLGEGDQLDWSLKAEGDKLILIVTPTQTKKQVRKHRE
jgi:bifunctional DNA-binding transcriptional regulator/antitoxin component of YhaV-PrlF toxin-antitoxin module